MEVQAHQLKLNMKMLDENIEVTNKYIESEESTMKINQQQIVILEQRIKAQQAELEQMKRQKL